MQTRSILAAVRDGQLPVAEEGPGYRIFECSVREAPAHTLFHHSSGEPIELGEPMLPLMDTAALHAFADEHGVARADDTPQEIYLYSWVERAQGPMIFDVGFVAAEGTSLPEGDHPYRLTRCPPLNVASVIYEGPFPFQEGSGWAQIDWERRAREQGLAYTERIYRELYHAYDWDSNRHVTEIQIEIA